MPKPSIPVGTRFGRLVVVGLTDKLRNSNRVYLCQCDCGQIKDIRGGGLKSGRTQSCGCLHHEILSRPGREPRRVTHGLSSKNRHPLYTTWQSMKQRCSNPKVPAYLYYGGRGIKVCDRWLGVDGFPNFLADVGERPFGTTLDRVDNDGNYEPGNVRWATEAEQHANRRLLPRPLHPTAKLSIAEAQEIRHRHATEAVTLQALGDEYGVSNGVVSALLQGRTYRPR